MAVEADRESKSRAKAKTPKKEEKFDGPVDGKGYTGDLTGYVPMWGGLADPGGVQILCEIQ